MYRSGFISLIGSPNVGKSTLMNKIVGQKVSIVSAKAQTTRNRIMGVLSGTDCQMVFLDTPGVTNPKNRLGEYMLKVAYDSLNEVEAILFLVDVTAGIREKDEALIEKLRTAKAPIIAVLNKIDIAPSLDAVETPLERLRQEPMFREILKISAETGEGVEKLKSALQNYLVPGPQYFPEDMVTDQPERLICAELIREKALMNLRDEIPHGIGVDIEKMQRREDAEDLMDIHAVIYCEREGHKGIIIGRGGSMLRKIGTEARHDMEWMLGERVNLQLHVKVKENWRNSISTMHELGYE